MDSKQFINDISNLHIECISRWNTGDTSQKYQSILKFIEENHSFNYQLWNAEDRARRDDKGFEFVYHAKREIDGFNQQRNNRMEMIDEWIYKELQPNLSKEVPVHSETPGMMIDRLSILALKAYHMNLQTQRQDAEEYHRQTCMKKHQVIEQQLLQLTLCLASLIDEVTQKTRTFRVYHQFKMYNDPNLNPELYTQTTT